jgi:glycosyltransferase involved in cell wall biosynthesis
MYQPAAEFTATENSAPRILYSSEGRSAIAAQFGAAHYSYRFAEQKFVELLSKMGHAPERIDLPPFYGPCSLAALARPAGGLTIHLIFRSTENIRTIAGCYNIACFAWEFDVLKTDTLPFEHPFANQKRMLDACEEVWAPSTYSAKVLRMHGVANVRRVPAPQDPQRGIATPADKSRCLRAVRALAAAHLKISNMIRFDSRSAVTSLTASSAINEAMEANQLFLTIFNPHDKRKNLQELLLGFMTVLVQYPHAALLVKLVIPERAQVNNVLVSDIAPRFERPISIESDRILFVCDYLAQEQLSALYDIADFYVCASVAEGQNLPLIEAMAHGLVPVSTVNTAMLDYLSDQNCIEIRTRKFSGFERRTAADVTQRPYAVEFCSQTDIGRALLRACSLSATEVQGLQRNAQQTVREVFSSGAVGGIVGKRIEAISRALQRADMPN